MLYMQSSPSRRPALRQRSSSGSLNALLQLQPASPPQPAPLQPHTSINGFAAPTPNQHGDKPGVTFAAPSTPSAVLQQLPAALSGANYRPAAALGTPQHPASGSPTAASSGLASAAALSPQQSVDEPAPGQFVLHTWSSGQLVAGADAKADLQWQLMASLRQLDEVSFAAPWPAADLTACCNLVHCRLARSDRCLLHTQLITWTDQAIEQTVLSRRSTSEGGCFGCRRARIWQGGIRSSRR